MKSDIMARQEEEILRLLDELKTLEPGSEKAKHHVEAIVALQKSIDDSEKNSNDYSVKNGQLVLDTQKQEDNQKLEEKKLELEKSKLDLESKKLEEAKQMREAQEKQAQRQMNLEEKKLAHLEKQAAIEQKHNRCEFWLGVGRIGFEAARIGLLVLAIRKGMGSVMEFEKAGIVRSKGWQYVDKMMNMIAK